MTTITRPNDRLSFSFSIIIWRSKTAEARLLDMIHVDGPVYPKRQSNYKTRMSNR